ncbi:MAG: capsule assembly Wzi family protein [Acidobacteriota bacterium]
MPSLRPHLSLRPHSQPRFHRWNSALLLAATLALPTFTVTMAAQDTSVPSAPIPTPVPASSFPSIPAATSAPATTPAPTAQQPASDPLTQPITVQPAPRPAAVQTPQVQATTKLPSLPPYDPGDFSFDHLSSTYIPVDSPIYPMALRLYSLGYLDTAFISMRPWTRRSLMHMLDDSSDQIMAEGNDEAIAILAKLQDDLSAEELNPNAVRGTVYGLESAYTRLMGIAGTPLRDSWHLGQTIANDYGRPYSNGFNSLIGFTSVNEHGRFSLYVRGEYQHAPSYVGYSFNLANTLSCGVDGICPFAPPHDPQDTIPYGNTGARNPFRIQEATLSVHLLNHEISFGKSDSWMGPGLGGSLAWTNNAEDIYAFRINRVEPLKIPLLWHIIGPMRYDFFVGSLQGHTYPNAPWTHSEMFAFRPTSNVEFGFQRTVIWGGHGHGCVVPGTTTYYDCNEPINLHTFLKSFFDINDTTGAEKYSRDDPGARFTAFNFSWRLPFMSHRVTLYTDSEAHDDVTPPSAPRRAAYRPGVYISQLPGLPKLDFRVEAVSTDTSTLRSLGGTFNYFETIQRQAYTNKGFIMGDWIGREAKGGQAWLTYHLSADDSIQIEYLNKKTPKDFIPGGTTQNQFKVEVIKHLRPELEMDAWFQYERWVAPIFKTGNQSDSVIAAQFTWFPRLKTSVGLNGK